MRTISALRSIPAMNLFKFNRHTLGLAATTSAIALWTLCLAAHGAETSKSPSAIELQDEINAIVIKATNNVDFFMSESGKKLHGQSLKNYQLCTNSNLDNHKDKEGKDLEATVNELKQEVLSNQKMLEKIVLTLTKEKVIGVSAEEHKNNTKAELDKKKKVLSESIRNIDRNMIAPLNSYMTKIRENQANEKSLESLFQGQSATFSGKGVISSLFSIRVQPRAPQACIDSLLYIRYAETKSLGLVVLPQKLTEVKKVLEKELQALNNVQPKSSNAGDPMKVASLR